MFSFALYHYSSCWAGAGNAVGSGGRGEELKWRTRSEENKRERGFGDRTGW